MHNSEVCFGQVLCHVPQVTFCFQWRKRRMGRGFCSGDGTGALSFHPGSSHAGPVRLRQPSAHPHRQQGLNSDYTSCSPITSCHSILDVRLDTSSSWYSLLSLLSWCSRDSSGFSWLSSVSSWWSHQTPRLSSFPQSAGSVAIGSFPA